ncbi:MAG: hypothetical protein JO153_04235 [Solirubrobacterales bacterium]|nr:hypothetical protein [Solirubrobacterales bacterium]MBV9915689.1 hypothetical protein [Solirubrobacterales bacterium]
MPRRRHRANLTDMLGTVVDSPPGSYAENPQLRDEVQRLQVENARLREENQRLREALDSHISRDASAPLYGPREMTAGTCVGPRRSRGSRSESTR